MHVRYDRGEAVFYVETSVESCEAEGLKVRELSKAEELGEEHQQHIMKKWHEHPD